MEKQQDEEQVNPPLDWQYSAEQQKKSTETEALGNVGNECFFLQYTIVIQKKY